jgi:hypothetical protein
MPATLIDRDRYRKLVRERLFPFVRDFATWWLPAGDERGLLVIDVQRERRPLRGTDEIALRAG